MKSLLLLAAPMLLANIAVADPPTVQQKTMQEELQRMLDAQSDMIEKSIESKLDAMADKSLQDSLDLNRRKKIEALPRATFGERATSPKHSLQQSRDQELPAQLARRTAR